MRIEKIQAVRATSDNIARAVAVALGLTRPKADAEKRAAIRAAVSAEVKRHAAIERRYIMRSHLAGVRLAVNAALLAAGRKRTRRRVKATAAALPADVL